MPVTEILNKTTPGPSLLRVVTSIVTILLFGGLSVSHGNADQSYTPPGVVNGLHFRKAGMHRNRFLSAGIALALGVIAMLLITTVAGERDRTAVAADQLLWSGYGAASTTVPDRAFNPEASPDRRSPTHWRSGYRNIRIIADYESPVISVVRGRIEYLPPIAIDQAPGIGKAGGDLPGRYPGIGDHGLPVQPMWQHTISVMPGFGVPFDGDYEIVDTRDKSRPPHAILANPQWPSQEQPSFYDTAMVEGFLVLHSTGRVTFELIRESHPNRGFAEEVERAMAYSRCYPAFDSRGQAITVRCRYRCVFTDSDEPSLRVSSDSESDRAYDGSITATVIR